jgi:hypothetical protein
MRSGYIYIGENVFDSLLAISNEEQTKGLMGEKPPVPVMSFIYPTPRINKFWMKDTPAELDIVFASNNKISQVCRGIPFSTQIIGNDTESDLVVELPYGTISSLGIKVNNSVGLLKPTIAEIKKLFCKF